jgi:spermidine synthase
MTIGVYLSALGLGSYLSKFIRDRIAQRFVEVELAAALIGGTSAPLLFLAFGHAQYFSVVLYGTVVAIGTLVGLELPLLMRILRDEVDFENLVAKVLTFDYVGALLGSLLFALLLVPNLGLARTSLLFGILNAAVGLATTWVLRERIFAPMRRTLRVRAVLLLALLCCAFVYADKLTHVAEEGMYASSILYAEQSSYQRIVVTKGGGSFQLHLNGNLQFSSVDEYRYHEALVHPAFAAAPVHRRVLVLGGGDGLAAREVYRYPDVEQVTLVDLDPAMTKLGKEMALLRELNEGALDDARTEIINADALVWLDREVQQKYDVILVDFPDPNNYSLGKLYSTWFYTLLQKTMHANTVVSVQSTSPLFARQSYWCVVQTIEASGLFAKPYHALVPAFGEWGYVLAKTSAFSPPQHLDIQDLRYLDDATLRSLFVFGKDMQRLPVAANRLNNQLLVHYYEEDWGRWN